MHSSPPRKSPPGTASSTDPLSPPRIRERLGHLLGDDDIVYLSNAARAAQGVERRYRDAFRRAIFAAAERALADLADGTFDPDTFDFQHLVTQQAIAAMDAGVKRPGRLPSRLAKGKALAEIFEQWDRWRKGKVPRRQAKNARTIRDVFLHTVQSFWRKNSQDFRRGDVYDQQSARDAFAKKAKIVVSRADMIVNTETTVYFNQARKQVYDRAEGVTHYLFVAIRDKRTTPWCTDFRKGGRDGLVYPKDSAVTDREFPACHWNCRSEMLPLSPSNPRHNKLIEDISRAREKNSPKPLPPGWKGR